MTAGGCHAKMSRGACGGPGLSGMSVMFGCDPPQRDSATRSYVALLREFVEPRWVYRLPWLGDGVKPSEVPLRARMRVVLQYLAQSTLATH